MRLAPVAASRVPAAMVCLTAEVARRIIVERLRADSGRRGIDCASGLGI